jgi:hypothetical protein
MAGRELTATGKASRAAVLDAVALADEIDAGQHRNVEEKVFVRRVPEAGGDYGWTVSVVRATGRYKGKEHCLAILCGGTVGVALATLCARHIAECMMIDAIEVDSDLATTED